MSCEIAICMCGGEKPISEIPLGIGYLISFCNNYDTNIRYYENPSDLLGIGIHECSAFAFSSAASGLREAVDVASKLRSRWGGAITTILGGQATLWNGCKDLQMFDYIVVGDGEIPMQAICGCIRDTGRRPVILSGMKFDDLDMIPHPYRGKVGHSFPIVTSRGCPYNCAFCSSQAQWGKPRYHSVEYVIEDVVLNTCMLDSVREIYIVDDLFMYPESRWLDLHKLWMKNNLQKRFSISGFTRTSLVTKDSLRMMREMNFGYLRLGIESGSNAVLKAIGKGVTAEDHQRVIDWAHEIGMSVRGSFVRGTPGETEEDRKLTAEFIERNKGKLEVMGNYVWKPFPGSRWYNGENPLTMDMRVR